VLDLPLRATAAAAFMGNLPLRATGAAASDGEGCIAASLLLPSAP